jgi:hypothetical protein
VSSHACRAEAPVQRRVGVCQQCPVAHPTRVSTTW